MSGRGKSLKSLQLISAGYDILAEIQPATVRAVCYRLFTLGLIGSMAKSETNRVSTQLVYAREQGRIPWAWIVDETREAERVGTSLDAADYADTIQRAYRKDLWATQPTLVEVWSEKGTVRGTLAPVLKRYGVTFRVMHGYASATAIYDVARESRDRGQRLLVLYAGDWDPSGLHMSEVDLPRRLEEYGAEAVEIVRVALIGQDVAHGGLPSFDADSKKADPRHGWYAGRYGQRCWELDALSPVILRERVGDAIAAELDADEWRRVERVEAEERADLFAVVGRWKAALQ